MEGLLGTQMYPPGQDSEQEYQTRGPRHMHHTSPFMRQSDLVPNNQTQEYLRSLPEEDGKENPGCLHQRQNFQHPVTGTVLVQKWLNL